MRIGRHVFFSGRVQGVGFRYNARHIASNYTITGFVKNLADGRVELLAEGENDEVKAYLNELTEYMADCISGKLDNQVPWTGRYNSFSIAY